MLDHFPSPFLDGIASRPFGIAFLIKHRAALARVALGMGEEEGAALVHALTDMMIDPTVDPLHWPIEETIALLRHRCAERNDDAELLVGQLTRLRDAIDVGGA